jgi:hypothetical protein
MPILFRGPVHVHYRQFYVQSRSDDFDDPSAAVGGQSNGLCGAAIPGFLFLTTGLHTGEVEVTIEALDQRPPVDESWEEVVEVSFRPDGDEVALVQWAGEQWWPLALEQIDYRVRYCASGMDAAQEQDSRAAGEPPADRYLLQFWPQSPEPDAVLRQTSGSAAYWHDHARTQPAPPTPEQRAEARRQQELARQQAVAENARRLEEHRWGGHLPDERVRGVNGALPLAGLDRELFDALQTLGDRTVRAIAASAARQACTAAKLVKRDWVAPALAALERGDPLPSPFDDYSHAFQALRDDRRAPQTSVASHDGRHSRISQQHMAIPSVFAAARTEPLAAAVEAIFHAVVTFGSGYRKLLTELRHEFPELATRP